MGSETEGQELRAVQKEGGQAGKPAPTREDGQAGKPAPTRILLLIKGLGLGGAERLLVSALPFLDREQFEYEVGYFLPWKNALVPEFQKAGVKVTCFEARSVWSWGAVRRVCRYVAENNFDLVHSHLPWSGIVGRIAARRAGVPGLVYTEHGSWERLHRVTRAVNRWTLHWNHLSIAVSDDVRQSMGNLNGHLVKTIENGIDTQALASVPDQRDQVFAEFGIPPEHQLLINVANLSPVKRHEVLLAAFQQVLAERPQTTLLVVGQLRDRAERLKQLAAELGVAERVIITGPRTDVPRLVKAADLFVLSSKSEGLPVSVLEAMALGKPVVSTAVGGIPAAVRDGQDGQLVPPEDPSQLAAAVLRVAADQKLARAMGASGMARVSEKYDISAMVREVEEEYRIILEQKRQVL